MQSIVGKKVIMARPTLSLTDSSKLSSLCTRTRVFRKSLGDIYKPFSSVVCRVTSRNSQRKSGKYLRSSFMELFEDPFLIVTELANFTKKLKKARSVTLTWNQLKYFSCITVYIQTNITLNINIMVTLHMISYE